MPPHFLAYLFCPSSSYCTPELENIHWKEGNTGLFVFISGLHGHPVWAAPYLSQIERERPNMEVKLPHVPHGGNCSLDEATMPILEMVQDYIHKHPGKPICLISTSNGSRIAARLEILLRTEPVAIRVTGIAGLFFGTTQTALSHPSHHPDIVSALQVGSELSQHLINAMREPLTQGARAYEFYAATNDWHIPNSSSSFPLLGKEEHYHLVSGWNHMSITEGVRAQELNSAYAWMDAHILVPLQRPCVFTAGASQFN